MVLEFLALLEVLEQEGVSRKVLEQEGALRKVLEQEGALRKVLDLLDQVLDQVELDLDLLALALDRVELDLDLLALALDQVELDLDLLALARIHLYLLVREDKEPNQYLHCSCLLCFRQHHKYRFFQHHQIPCDDHL